MPATRIRNAIIVLADQLHAGALGCLGHPVVRTPNLDRLAAEGVAYTRAYTTCPLCMPARVSLLTGLHPLATQIYSNNQGRRIRPGLPTIAGHLAAHGFHTGTTGKYHAEPLGDAGFERRIPMDEYAAFLRARGKSWAAGYNIPDLARHPSPSISCSTAPLAEDETRSAFEADCALRFLEERPAERPFLLWMNFDAPHGPYILPPRYAGMYDPAAIRLPAADYDRLPPEQRAWLSARSYDRASDAQLRQALAWYYASITEMDAQLGRVLDRLDASGLAGDTALIFLADHGDHAGERRLVNKSFAYESTIRIPLLARVPGVAGGGRRDDLVQTVDIVPTLCRLLGVAAPPGLHGRVLPGLGAAPSVPPRSQVLCDELYYRTLVTRDWKLVYAPPHHCWGDGQGFTSQLYHLAEDPGETRNRFEDPACRQVREAMMGGLLAELCAAEIPLLPSDPQAITTTEHQRLYGDGHRRFGAWQRRIIAAHGDHFTPVVHLPTAGGLDQGWAGGG